MSIYTINYTDPLTTPFTIIPGAINTTTDLVLRGQGSLLWGEHLNEDLLHLLENFAHPESAPGLPDSALLPNPIPGQMWFNKTDSTPYLYDGAAWNKVAGASTGLVPPSGPDVGDLWYDTGVPQLKVWEGASWVSVADRYLLEAGGTMTGTLTLNADPTAALEAATKQYVDNAVVALPGTYVDVAGDTMTGFLTLNAAPTAILHAATKDYVDTEIAAATSGLGASVPEIFVTLTPPSSKTGDIAVVAGKVYMHNGVGFQQIFPAIYL